MYAVRCKQIHLKNYIFKFCNGSVQTSLNLDCIRVRWILLSGISFAVIHCSTKFQFFKRNFSARSASSVKMTPIAEFNWCLRVLRYFLQIVSMDIFDENFQYTFLSRLIVAFYTSAISCYIINICFSHDQDLIFTSMPFTPAFFSVPFFQAISFGSNRQIYPLSVFTDIRHRGHD